MKVILHAGLPKTGSSALQRFLSDHREPLRENGVIYPAFDDHPGHWRLAAALTGLPAGHPYARRMRARGRDGTADDVKAKLRRTPPAVTDAGVAEWCLSHACGAFTAEFRFPLTEPEVSARDGRQDRRAHERACRNHAAAAHVTARACGTAAAPRRAATSRARRARTTSTGHVDPPGRETGTGE